MANNSVAKPLQFCLQVTRALDQVGPAPINIMENANVLDALRSPSNLAGWNELDRVSLPGKTAPGTTVGGTKVYLEYEKPYCAGGESSNTAVCDATSTTNEEKGWLEVVVNKVAERNFTVTKEEFATFCETPNERVMNILKRKAYEIKMEINEEAIKALYAHCGVYKSSGLSSLGATAKNITMINSSGNFMATGLAKIKREYRLSNWTGKNFVFGGDVVATSLDVRALQGMGQNGQNITEDIFVTMDYIYDNSLDVVMQDLEGDELSHGLTMPVASFVMQEHYLHEGYQTDNESDVIRNKMTIDGLTFDYAMVYDKCGGPDKAGIWKVQLKKLYGFGGIPAAAYCGEKGLTYHWLFNSEFEI